MNEKISEITPRIPPAEPSKPGGAVSYAGQLGGARPGAGRPPGVPNQYNKDVRAMVLGALEAVGGQAYLQRQALQNPAIFLSLVARTMPVKVVGDPEHPVEMRVTVASNLRDAIEVGFSRVEE